MIYDLTTFQFIKMLHNLTGLLDKAAQFAESKVLKDDAVQIKRNACVADPSQVLARRKEFGGKTKTRTGM